MVAYNKFQDFVEQLVRGIHDFDAHTFKVYLSNTAPDAAADAVKADLAEIGAGNGYVAGGATVTAAISEVTGTVTVTGTQVTWTASGGSIGPFQYVVLYNDSAVADNLISWWDRGSALTLNDGDSFTPKFNNTSPGNVFTIA